jgi:signal transduction histidine kinase/HD-like signal output (HDOD) protein
MEQTQSFQAPLWLQQLLFQERNFLSISDTEHHKVCNFAHMKSFSAESPGGTGAYGQLPTLPQILLKLLELFSKEPIPVQQVCEVLGNDPALSARVLGMVNLIHDGGPDRMTRVDKAVSLLNMDTVRNIVMSAAVNQAFHPEMDESLLFQLKHSWRHALMSATLAKSIAEKAAYQNPHEAFLSGLFHDMGKLAFAAAPPKKDDTDSEADGKESEGPPLEQGMNNVHCQAGAEMIHRWNLPSFMVDAVLYHHEPVHRILNSLPLVKIVFVANILCSGHGEQAESKFEIANQVVGLNKKEAEELLRLAEKSVQEAAQFCEIALEPVVPEKLQPEKDVEKQKKLVRAVRDISLVQSTLQDSQNGSNLESILNINMQALKVLFDVQAMLLFLYDQETETLLGNSSMGTAQDGLVRRVAIRVEKEQGILAECLLRQSPLDSFGRLQEVELSILDHQILRLIGTDGMLCLPLMTNGTYIGVVVLGVSQAEASYLFEEMDLLKRFADRAALNVHAESTRQAQPVSMEPDSSTAPSDLAKKVVHEVSNPLGIIKNYLGILGSHLAEEGKGQEEIRIINEEIDRVSGIVRKLSDFSKPSTQKQEPLDINALISDLIKITHEPLLVQSNIKAHFTEEPSLPPIVSDKNGLKQVLINLIKNAVEAMPEGGSLYIQTRNVSGGPESDQDGPGDEGPAYAEISIRDEGPGIPEAMRSRLFEPFVSSKGAGHAGLGLSIAHGIVRDLNGTITCESAGKKGTIFKVVLPT